MEMIDSEWDFGRAKAATSWAGVRLTLGLCNILLRPLGPGLPTVPRHRGSTSTAMSSATPAAPTVGLPPPPVLNIISTHKLSAKTTRCLSALYPSTATGLPPPAIGIQAKGPVAAKAITLVEIVKRRIEEKGDTWYQYNVLESVEPRQKQVARAVRIIDDDEAVDEQEDPFTPYEESAKKQPPVPVLTVYLSLERLPELAGKWGEQTNSTAACG